MAWEMEKKIIYKTHLAQTLNEIATKIDVEINKLNYFQTE